MPTLSEERSGMRRLASSSLLRPTRLRNCPMTSIPTSRADLTRPSPIRIWCSLFCCSYGLMSEASNLVDGRQTVRNHGAWKDHSKIIWNHGFVKQEYLKNSGILNKPYLSVDCIISQIILLVRRPTLLKMRIRKTSRIFINTTSSELGSLPPNLERTNEFKTKFMLTQVAPRVGDCICQVFHCAGDVRLGLVNHVAGQELVHGCQRQTCHILNIRYNF